MTMSDAPRTSRRWWALAVIAAAQFMAIMDTSIVAVALPQMQADLGFSQQNLTWVFNAYVVALGGLLLLGGRLSDLFGARRMFTAGWLVLLVGSAIAGLAGAVAVELAGRAVQGVGAALLVPAALTLLMMLFGNDPKELTRALAFYGAAAPAGGTAGVFLGGVLTGFVNWPWVFFINIPVALIALVAIPALMPPGNGGQRGTVDVAGAVTATAGLGAVVYAIVRAPEVGWNSAQTWQVLAGAVVVLGVFVAIQATRRQPLMPLSIFRTPNLSAANVAQLLLGGAWIPMWFFLNLYLQQVLGYSAFPSGAALLPMTVLIIIGMVVLAPPLIARFGPKALTVTGLIVLTAGMLWLSLIRPDGSFWVDVLPASLVAALGMSLAFIPSLGTAISSARPEEGGLASGIVNTSYQVGSALGLAAITAVAAALGADQLGNEIALTNGFSWAFIGAAIIAGAGALISLVAWRSHPSPAPDTEPGDPESEPVPTGVPERDIRRNGPHSQATEPETVATGNGSAESVPEPGLAGAGWQPLVNQPGQDLGPARTPVAAAGTPPTRQIRGRVHRPDGTGVAGAALTAIDADGHQIARGQATADGAYRIALDAAGSYVLIASAPAHQPVATPVFVGNGPVDQEVMLNGTAALTGTVRAAATGTPLSAAATLTNQDGDVVATTVTDAAGGYRLATLGAGHYTLVVTTEAFEVAAQAVTVAETGDTPLDVTLTGAARLAGTVRAGGRPVRDARVVLADTAGAVAASAYTDDDGHYRFTGLEAGDYTVIASGYPAVCSPVAIERGYDRHDIELAHPNGHTVDRGEQIAAAGPEEQQ